MKKELKDQVIESISAQLKEYPHFYVTDISGLNAEDTVKLRRSCFEQGIKLTVVKNTLFAHVLKQINNEDLNQLLPTLKGNTAIMYAQTASAPGKLIKKLNKDGMEKPVLKGAYAPSSTSWQLSSLRRNSLAISSACSRALPATSSALSRALAESSQALSRPFRKKKKINNKNNFKYYQLWQM